jgi:hypothetical protein
MPSSEAQRTLVKSPPELWAELSDPDSLARHLGELGEIRITRVEPEETVEWEGRDVRGTVQIKPAGWGTRVTLTATRETPAPEAAFDSETNETAPTPEVVPEPRRRLFARLFRRRRHTEQPAPEIGEAPEPEPETEMKTEAEAEAEPSPEAPDIAAELARVEEAMTEQDAALLTAVLDRLGAAHHRPFSRA